MASIPKLRGTPILGHTKEFRENRLKLLAKVARTCGDLGSFYLFQRRLTLVNNPELIRELLLEKANSFVKSPGLELAKPVLGNGLLTSGGSFWRRQRKLIAPTFQPNQITGFADSMGRCVLQGIEQWQDGAVIDISREMMKITLNIVAETLFGADSTKEADSLGDALTTVLRWVNREITLPSRALQFSLFTMLARAGKKLPPLLRNPAVYLSTRLREERLWTDEATREFQKAKAVLDEKIQRMITERRASAETRSDLLSRLLSARDEESGGQMTDQQIHDEAMTLFLAGHETTANALTWTLYLLSQHPEVAKKLKEEVDTVENSPPSLEDLARLPYTLKVFKEAMRLYPPAYLFGRMATEDVEIGGHHFPAWSIFFVSPYLLHRRPDFWPAPKQFDPERFSPEQELARTRYTYLPFGAGPRICIGNHFAMMEGHILLATLAKKIDFSLLPGQRVIPETVITLRPKHSIWMRVKHRSS